MKVLQINSVCGVGSTGRIATDLYKVLEEEGHECVIAYGRGSAPDGINAIKIGTNFDNYIHVANTRMFDRHGFGSVRATKEFIKRIEEYNPDIIQLHNIHGYYINIEILFNYLRRSNKKVIWTLHDCWAFTGHCTHFEYANCYKWKRGCENCQQIDQYPKSIIDNSRMNYEIKKKLFTSLDKMTIVTPSKWLQNLVQKSYLNKYNVEVINNGVDLKKFKPSNSNFRVNYGLENKFIILGIASILGKRKGIEYFFELANMLDLNYKIILVGLSSTEIKKLPNNIIGLQRTNDVETLKKIYTMADVFFNPTLEEVFGMTNIEALACGTPVITFNTGGSPECINGDCGYVVEKGDMKEVYKCILHLKNKRKFTDDIISCADKFEKYQKYKMYMNLYKR